MSKIKFTAGRISDFKCLPDKLEATLWDADVKGLGLRATAKSKSYVFLSMLKDGRKVRITIGDPSHYTIDDA